MSKFHHSNQQTFHANSAPHPARRVEEDSPPCRTPSALPRPPGSDSLAPALPPARPLKLATGQFPEYYQSVQSEASAVSRLQAMRPPSRAPHDRFRNTSESSPREALAM